ncbi:integrase [Hyperthermus butylicus]|nr:integrase [Hyperthermus butylicus]
MSRRCQSQATNGCGSCSRHYANYLYTRGEISHQTLHWIQARVPGRRTPKTPRNPAVDLEELRSTLAYLAGNHERYYLLYRLMLESGLRFEHALRLLASPILEGSVVVYDRVYPRLYCDEGRGFCRLYLGFNQGVKRAEFAYFSTKTRRLVEDLTPWSVHRRSVERYVSRHGLMRPGLLRKASWQLLIASGVPREVARFIHSRFGELRVSESYYEGLVREADQWYPRYLKHLKSLNLT